METTTKQNRMPKRLTITSVQVSPEFTKAFIEYSEKMRNLTRVFCTEEKDGLLKFISIAETPTTQQRQLIFWLMNFIETETEIKTTK
jgi:hypothetical protein